MSLYTTIQNDVKTAMKAGDSVRVGVLRFVLAALNARKKEHELAGNMDELSDGQAQEVLTKEVKRRRESISMYASANRQDLVDDETAQLQVIEGYLPKGLSSDEVALIVDEVIAQANPKEFPVVVKAVMARIAGRADGKMVSEMIKHKLGV